MKSTHQRRQLGFSFDEESDLASLTAIGRRRRPKKQRDRQLLLFHPYEQAELPID